MVFLTSNFVTCAFKSSITLNSSVCSSSFLVSFSFLAILSFFNFSIFSPLLETCDFISSICFFVSSICFSSSIFSFSSFSIWAFLISTFLVCVSISLLIISDISWIDISLSLNDDTDIFKSVISSFKLSIYVWLSLFELANSSIIACFSSFSFEILAISCSSNSFEFNNSFLLSSDFEISSFCLFILSLIIWIFSSIDSTLCFSVA